MRSYTLDAAPRNPIPKGRKPGTINFVTQSSTPGDSCFSYILGAHQFMVHSFIGNESDLLADAWFHSGIEYWCSYLQKSALPYGKREHHALDCITCRTMAGPFLTWKVGSTAHLVSVYLPWRTDMATKCLQRWLIAMLEGKVLLLEPLTLTFRAISPRKPGLEHDASNFRAVKYVPTCEINKRVFKGRKNI